MGDPTDAPSVNNPTGTPEVDNFGPPHAHTIAESLHLWILIPGLFIILFIGKSRLQILQHSFCNHCQIIYDVLFTCESMVLKSAFIDKLYKLLILWFYINVTIIATGYLFYRLIRKQGERDRKREEKKRLKQEKKEKKKGR